MPANKATPKGEITLVSKGDEGWKFAHSPSGLADFSIKQKLGKKFTFGVGFTVSVCGHDGAAGSGMRLQDHAGSNSSSYAATIISSSSSSNDCAGPSVQPAASDLR